MLDSQSAAFAERVWDVASQLGNNAPKIADDIMEAAFPLTCSQARAEGAMRMLRTGIISEVKRILRNRRDLEHQSDFADRCDAFAPLVSDLRSKSYFVESAEEYVAVPDLIAEPDLLDDALSIAPLFWSKGLSWNTTDEAALKDAEQRVETLAKHIKAFNSYPVQEVASGSVILAQIWNGNARQAIDSSGNENLVFVYPEPKSELWLDSYHIPIGAKSLKAAHSWINYVLDPEVAAREITYTGFLSPVSGVEAHLDAAVASDPLIFPPPDAIARGEKTQRNETYDRRVAILTKFKAAAAQ